MLTNGAKYAGMLIPRNTAKRRQNNSTFQRATNDRKMLNPLVTTITSSRARIHTVGDLTMTFLPENPREVLLLYLSRILSCSGQLDHEASHGSGSPKSKRFTSCHIGNTTKTFKTISLVIKVYELNRTED